MLKEGDAIFLRRYVHRVRTEFREHHRFVGYFDATTVLIPVPGCQPQLTGIASNTEYLSAALIEAGLGERVWNGLRRTMAVPKSATAAGGERPSVQRHYESFAVACDAGVPSQILLVDDVVTKGRTLLAAAARLQEAFPQTPIRSFAFLRTMGFVTDVSRLLDPCVGEIHWQAGDARRAP
jgi:predicted amidophosphoribosyltransferase